MNVCKTLDDEINLCWIIKFKNILRTSAFKILSDEQKQLRINSVNTVVADKKSF
jgi:hypothetical protein